MEVGGRLSPRLIVFIEGRARAERGLAFSYTVVLNLSGCDVSMQYHPVVDNPIRMAYVPNWIRVTDLIERLDKLALEVGSGRTIPARWEPYYEVCPSARDSVAYFWARTQIQNPLGLAAALALFPDNTPGSPTLSGHANWLLLCAHAETSTVTRKLMMTEALEMWVSQASVWLRQVQSACAGLGVEVALHSLAQRVQNALEHLQSVVFACDRTHAAPPSGTTTPISYALDPALLQMDGWTQVPSTVVLPVDGLVHSFVNHTLLLELHKVTLLKGWRRSRSVAWERVTHVTLFDGAIHFGVVDEPSLIVSGFRHPEEKLKTIQDCYKAATERILHAVAAEAIRTTR